MCQCHQERSPLVALHNPGLFQCAAQPIKLMHSPVQQCWDFCVQNASQRGELNPTPFLSAGKKDEEDDIAAQVGVGSAAADSELDALKDVAEAQLSAVDNLLGSFAGTVASFCHQRYCPHAAPTSLALIVRVLTAFMDCRQFEWAVQIPSWDLQPSLLDP